MVTSFYTQSGLTPIMDHIAKRRCALFGHNRSIVWRALPRRRITGSYTVIHKEA